jgi:hypothetical protein
MGEPLVAQAAILNDLKLDIQTFARSWPLARGHPTLTLESSRFPMGLFKPDLYRAFFLGFGVTALAMAAQFAHTML